MIKSLSLFDKIQPKEVLPDFPSTLVYKSHPHEGELLEEFEGVIESDESKGFIRLYDKRGTGKMIDTVYNFNKDRLMLEESNFDPKMFLEEIGGDKKNKKKLDWA